MIDDVRPGSGHSPEHEKPPVHEHSKPQGNGDVKFRTPESIAEAEDKKEVTAAGVTVSHHAEKHWWRHLSKKQWIIIAVVAVVLIGGVTATVLALHKSKVPVVAVKKATKPVAKSAPAPAPLTSDLTGLPITDAATNNKPVTGIMIENSTDARPQSGLDQAGVVFEAVAEGGITRFLALYQDSAPSYVGPVRSVRPYYIQWAQGFDAAIAHVGGSPEALNDMTAWNVKNLDQFVNGSFFQRITSRYAPHNVYTSLDNMSQLEAKLGYGKPSFTPLARKAAAPAKAPTVTSIDFAISGYYYNVHYDYDAASNSYKRSEAGAPHMEIGGTGAQTPIAPKVVIGLVMNQGIESDDLHTSYDTIGSGPMYLFQDGVIATGTWHKTSATSQFTFTDTNGSPLKLNPGQTWLTVVGSSSYVSYK